MKRLFALLALACLFSSAPLLAQSDPVTRAIDRGIENLLPVAKQQLQELKSGRGRVAPTIPCGAFVFDLYALVVSGVSVNHPTIRGGLELLERMSFQGTRATYVTAAYIFLLDASIAQIETDYLMLNPKRAKKDQLDNPRIGRQFRKRLHAAVNSLVSSQNAKGGWRYAFAAQDFDNSNVQFAVLALGIGAKRGVKIPPQTWQKVMDHFLRTQESEGPETAKRLTMEKTDEDRRDRVELVPKDGGSSRSKKRGSGRGKKDGKGKTGVKEKVGPENPIVGLEGIDVHSRGWAYLAALIPGEGKREGHSAAKWTMSCAGLSSMLLARENLRDSLRPSELEELNRSIRDGYGWVMDHWSPTNGNGYGMYSLEKVGDIGHVKLFAGHDWYAGLEKHLLAGQKKDGSWEIGGHNLDVRGLGTAYALLILNRATSLLTQSPASRIIISGRNAPKGELGDRNWVYVPSLDTTLHFPSLMRAIRLRPSATLIKFLRNIVDHYADEWKGELLPELVRVRKSATSKASKKVVDGYLAAITGYKYEEFESYLKWHKRWKHVMEVAEKGDKSAAPKLLEYYEKATKSVPLRKTIMWALTRIKAREAIPRFLEDLDHDDAVVRLAAYTNLRSFYVDFPPRFEPQGSESSRKRQVAAIRDWQMEQEDRRR